MTPGLRLLRWLGGLGAAALAAGGLLCVAGLLLFFATVSNLPRVPEPLRRIIETPPTEIFAASGERVFQIGGRSYVSVNQVSRHFIQAILATEDHHFREHKGINKLRTLKALGITFFGIITWISVHRGSIGA